MWKAQTYKLFAKKWTVMETACGFSSFYQWRLNIKWILHSTNRTIILVIYGCHFAWGHPRQKQARLPLEVWCIYRSQLASWLFPHVMYVSSSANGLMIACGIYFDHKISLYYLFCLFHILRWKVFFYIYNKDFNSILHIWSMHRQGKDDKNTFWFMWKWFSWVRVLFW